MGLTIPQLQQVIASYVSATSPKLVSDYVVGTGASQVDLTLLALNTVKAQAQKEHDFQYEIQRGQLTVDMATGGSLDSVVDATDGTTPLNVKGIKGAYLSNNQNILFPIEFVDKQTFSNRLFEQDRPDYPNLAYRYPADGDRCNGWNRNVLYQSGRQVFLWPGTSTAGTIKTVYLDVACWLYEFTSDQNTNNDNFLLANGQDWLQWAAIIEMNFLAKAFVSFRQEGAISTADAQKQKDAAWRRLLQWDDFIVEGGRVPQGY